MLANWKGAVTIGVISWRNKRVIYQKPICMLISQWINDAQTGAIVSSDI
jgi:hypothetical protein